MYADYLQLICKQTEQETCKCTLDLETCPRQYGDLIFICCSALQKSASVVLSKTFN